VDAVHLRPRPTTALIVVENQSPVFPPSLTANFDLSPRFCKIPISLTPIPKDFSVAQFMPCVMESNAF